MLDVKIYQTIRGGHRYRGVIKYNAEAYIFENVRWLTYSNCRGIDVMGDTSDLMRYF